jgi:hypothetical protein
MSVLRVLAAVVVTALAVPAPAGATVVIKPRGTPAWLVRDAFKFAGWLDDPRPRRIRITLGRFDTISLRGHFVCAKSCSYPPGAKPPHGTLAQYVIDPRTRGVTSFSLGH